MKTALFRAAPVFAAILLSAAPSALRAAAAPAGLPALWAERVKSVVAVEFHVESESDRQTAYTYGTVIDRDGLVIVPAAAVEASISATQLKDFKVYRPGDAKGLAATYLGQDALTGWHFIRISDKVPADLVPVTAFAAQDGPSSPVPSISEEVWGIGLRGKDEDFLPYIMVSRIGIIESLPQKTAIGLHEICSPGLPAFNESGVFLGLGISSFGQSFMQFSGGGRGPQPVLLVNVEESSAFVVAAEVLPYLGRVPKNVRGRPLPWLGASGLEPIDPEAATFMKLDNQGAVVVSEVLEGSPAEKIGLKDRDIVVAMDGRALPRLKPSGVVVGFVERELARRAPGDTVSLTVLRGSERIELKPVLADQPKLAREADRKYFDHLGVTVREVVFDDAVSRRMKVGEMSGVVAHYVKANSPTAIAGLAPDDWIREIDGVEIKTFSAAVEKLAAIEADPSRTEFVILAGRGRETAVLRVKLK